MYLPTFINSFRKEGKAKCSNLANRIMNIKDRKNREALAEMIVRNEPAFANAERKAQFILNIVEDYFKNFFDKGQEQIKEIFSASETMQEFVEKVLERRELMANQVYCELAMYCSEDFCAMLEQAANHLDCYETSSDAGGVRLYNAEGYVIVSNGIGDGICHVVVGSDDGQPENSFLRYVMNFQCSIGGTHCVSAYDCTDSDMLELKGRYGVYSKEGYVYLEKWFD